MISKATRLAGRRAPKGGESLKPLSTLALLPADLPACQSSPLLIYLQKALPFTAHFVVLFTVYWLDSLQNEWSR
ncbi:hypothetical protein ASPBRDRAFT_538421 [Aspergillus brasiliensis CBS 101740]|uniref:Uncharacterized protein n=1 Tax=Aspergillus brasiliensis (strain CBS 101740 / IMI 381727 / IBT 21946) TaxID=767769 RepID=A0A1L9ULD6_ASPBC|nr:hypothetical protein ASPBRDRAFT_538421 [Aspergillus brasiliensis CBS 101740]